MTGKALVRSRRSMLDEAELAALLADSDDLDSRDFAPVDSGCVVLSRGVRLRPRVSVSSHQGEGACTAEAQRAAYGSLTGATA